jgi:hypothetical protein
MNNGNWIKLNRELFERPIWLNSTAEQKVVLIAILGMVNHAPAEWEWKGEKYSCEPGQKITSLPKIVEQCGKGITIQNVRTALKRFEKLGFLTDESTEQGRLITVVNWGKYQHESCEPNRQPNRQLTDDQQTANRRLTSNKNNKNNKNDKEERESIEREPPPLKSAYGRKGNVLLTDAEYQGIKDRFVDYDGLINHVGDYLANSRHYDDHEALIFKIGTQDKWAVKAQVKSQELSQEEIDRMRAEQWGQDWKN